MFLGAGLGDGAVTPRDTERDSSRGCVVTLVTCDEPGRR